ncbi:MAG: hypothetical protein K8R57_02540 [Verrucomicrobia bacterium]|nr:hypothetical protein [Verrucomicrobiota bacterium]
MSSTVTIELDDAATSTLRSLAETWHLAPQEALKRAVSVAASTLPIEPVASALQALRQLQREVCLTSAQADAWKDSVVQARR